MCISETWLKPHHPDDILRINGYKQYRKDRIGRRGGGLSIYVKHHYNLQPWNPITLVPLPADSKIESFWCQLKLPETLPITIGVCYCPPDLSIQAFHDLQPHFESVLKYAPGEIIILGDFNCDLIPRCKSSNTKAFGLSTSTLQQLIKEITRPKSGTLIDHIYVSHPSRIISSGVIPFGASDHSLIYCVRKIHLLKQPTKFVKSRRLSLINPINFVSTLQENLSSFEKSETLCWNFQSAILNTLNHHAPLRSIRIHINLPPWINDNIKHLMYLRDHHSHRRRAANGDVHNELYKSFRNAVTIQLRISKKSYLGKELNRNHGNSSKTWKTLRTFIKAKPNSTIVEIVDAYGTSHTTPVGIANALNSHFSQAAERCLSQYLHPNTFASSLTSISQQPPATTRFEFLEIDLQTVVNLLKQIRPNKATGPDLIPPKILKAIGPVVAPFLQAIINNSFSASTYPEEWKLGRIIPIAKGGDATNPDNFRPIVITPCASKIMEQVALKQIQPFLSTNNLLYKHQSGFRPGYSTITCAVFLLETIITRLSYGQIVGVVFIDLRKAFDTVDHQTLLTDLSKLGFTNEALDWMASYLKGRTQRVDIGEYSSSTLPVNYGVPQGSILGPILFSIYINEAHLALTTDCKLILYADDQAVIASNHDPSDLISILDNNVLKLQNYLFQKKQVLNPTKSYFMLFHKKQSINLEHIVKLPISSLERVSSFKYLGLELDESLSWGQHILKTYEKVNKRSWIIRSLRPSLDIPTLTLLFKSIIQPLYDYGDILYGTASASKLNKLQVQQSAICKIITGQPRRSSASTALETLSVLKLQQQRYLHIAAFMHHAFLNHFPDYISELFRQPSAVHNHVTRGSQRNLFVEPLASNLRNLSLRHRGTTLWNNLPNDIRDISNTPTFKKAIRALTII